jgi:alkyl sulfatase BDS1-like metallo-beta-lactamase superfamily hydrolase
VVRNPHVWARYLTETIELFGGQTDVLFASHHWPTWGHQQIKTFLTQQRDLYAFLHDQTLRFLNQGYTGIEIAEMMQLPPALEQAWNTRGYYGSVSHNVKAIYQHYMGWFDGNPAHLWELPPVEAAKKHVEYMGGADVIIEKVKAEQDNPRWAAQVLNYIVFADPGNTRARELLAGVYESLGHGAENGTWRNFYLQGAEELRGNMAKTKIDTTNPDMSMALSVGQIFDSLAIRVNGPKAWDKNVSIDWNFTDLNKQVRLQLSNGALIQTAPNDEPAQLRLTLTKPALLRMLATQRLDGITADGNQQALATLIDLLDTPEKDFPIVTP